MGGQRRISRCCGEQEGWGQVARDNSLAALVQVGETEVECSWVTFDVEGSVLVNPGGSIVVCDSSQCRNSGSRSRWICIHIVG